MKSSSPSRKTPSGFTLIELIVTMSILSIILLMALQVTESTRRSIRVSEAKSTNDAIARRAFDQIGRDLSQMVVRDDARIEFKSESGNDTLQFYSATRGLNANASAVSDRSASLVSYATQYDSTLGYQFQRSTLGYDFNGGSGSGLNLNFVSTKPSENKFGQASSAKNLQTLSSNIFRIELQYLYEDIISTGSSTTSKIIREINEPNSSDKTAQKLLRGVIVTLATLDDRSRRAIRPERLKTLADQFHDATASKDPLTEWTEERDKLALNGSASLPKDALQSIRCYQRTFLIP